MKLQLRNKKLWEHLKALSKKVDSEISKRSNSESHVKKKSRTIGTEVLNNFYIEKKKEIKPLK